MITIELLRYEPEGGRQYRGAGKTTTAMECIRLDCEELHYTKVLGPDIQDLTKQATALHGQAPEIFVHNETREWLEGILVRFRGRGADHHRCWLAVGYQMFFVHQGQRALTPALVAQLGPEKTND